MPEKRPRGRPPLGPGESKARRHHLHMKLTAARKQRLQEKADAAGVKITDLVRGWIDA